MLLKSEHGISMNYLYVIYFERRHRIIRMGKNIKGTRENYCHLDASCLDVPWIDFNISLLDTYITKSTSAYEKYTSENKPVQAFC